MQNVKIVRLPSGEGLPLPAYATDGAAGVDLMAARILMLDGTRYGDNGWWIDAEDGPKMHRLALIGTGFAIHVPTGYEAQVRPRSGIALKNSVTVLNTPGTIDADYRGEVCVLLINHSTLPFQICRGDRIAQLVFAPVTRAAIVEAESLGDTERGAGGFGSTGT